jgi:hypothetical protein
MLTLNDGRNELWQWDTGRKLAVDADCSQVHFSNKVFGRSIDVDVVDGVAIIPDILLQTDKELTAWAFVGTAENGYTKISKVLKVNKRNKPSDYVFTPTDQTTLGEILDRIEYLENRPSGDVSEEDIQNAVNDYLEKNPVSIYEKDPTVPAWAKEPEKPKYTADEVGALPADTKIPDAPDLSGYVLSPETAKVGQTIVVKSVDETGQPVEWEAVDFPSGGGGWSVVIDMNINEETYLVRQDVSGYDEYLILIRTTPGSGSNKSTLTFDVYIGNNSSERYQVTNAVWNDGKTAIITQAHFMKPQNANWIYGVVTRKNENSSSGQYNYAGTKTAISRFEIYTSSADNVFGAGTQVQIFGR